MKSLIQTGNIGFLDLEFAFQKLTFNRNNSNRRSIALGVDNFGTTREITLFGNAMISNASTNAEVQLMLLKLFFSRRSCSESNENAEFYIPERNNDEGLFEGAERVNKPSQTSSWLFSALTNNTKSVIDIFFDDITSVKTVGMISNRKQMIDASDCKTQSK